MEVVESHFANKIWIEFRNVVFLCNNIILDRDPREVGAEVETLQNIAISVPHCSSRGIDTVQLLHTGPTQNWRMWYSVYFFFCWINNLVIGAFWFRTF